MILCALREPPLMGFSRQDYWSGLPFPSPGDLPDPGIEPRSPTLQADAFNRCTTRETLVQALSHTSKGCQVPVYLQTFISLGSPIIQLGFCSNNFIRGAFFFLFYVLTQTIKRLSAMQETRVLHCISLSFPRFITLLYYFILEYQLIVYWLSLLTRMSGLESWDLSALCLVVGIQYTFVWWINCMSWNFGDKVIF